MKRRSGSEPVASDGWSLGGCVFASGHPRLHEFLSCAVYDDGSARKTGTLLVFVDSGLLKACLSDRDVSQVAFASANSMAGLLEALEGGLLEESLDWRVAGGGKQRKR